MKTRKAKTGGVDLDGPYGDYEFRKPNWKIQADAKVKELCAMIEFEINSLPLEVEGMRYYRQMVLEKLVEKLTQAI